jgi:hypothetical protein
VAGEAAHAVLRMYRYRAAAPQLVDLHGTVLDTESAPVAGLVVDLYFYQLVHLYRINYMFKNFNLKL